MQYISEQTAHGHACEVLLSESGCGYKVDSYRPDILSRAIVWALQSGPSISLLPAQSLAPPDQAVPNSLKISDRQCCHTPRPRFAVIFSEGIERLSLRCPAS